MGHDADLTDGCLMLRAASNQTRIQFCPERPVWRVERAIRIERLKEAMKGIFEQVSTRDLIWPSDEEGPKTIYTGNVPPEGWVGYEAPRIACPHCRVDHDRVTGIGEVTRCGRPDCRWHQAAEVAGDALQETQD